MGGTARVRHVMQMKIVREETRTMVLQVLAGLLGREIATTDRII